MKYLWSSRLFTTVLGIVLMTSATTAKSGRQAVNGPLIQTYPNKMNENKEVMLQIGQNFTITCKGMRKVDIRQQERREEVVGNFSMTSEDQVLVDDVYQHMQSLHLYYVDHNAVGYYACFDDTLLMEVFDVLDEPTDTQHVSYIYVYVYDNGSDPKLLAPVTDFALYINSSYVVIPCRPTSPDINITLYLQQTETPEIIKYSPKIGYLVRPCVNLNHCSYLCQLTREPYNSSKEVGIKHTTSEECTGIKISGESEYFMDDETFILNCTVPYQHNSVVELYWTAPRNDSKVTHEYNGHDVELGEIVFSAIKITNASKEDAGSYTCVCKGYMVYRNKTTKKTYLDNAYLELQTKKNTGRLEVQKELPFVSLSVGVKAYPKPNFTFYRDNQLLEVNYKDRSCKSFGAPKYFKEVTITNDIKLYICNLTVYDSGNYTVAANNSYIQKNITFDVRKKATPLVKISPEDNIIYHVIKQRKALRCEVIGLPLAKVEWIYTPDDGKPETMFGKETSELVYKVVSSLEINPSISGNVTCIATIGKDVNETTKRVLVYEKQRGFGIMDNENRWYPEGHDVTLQCLASIYDFKNLSWRGPDGEDVLENVKYYDSKLSHVGVLHINHVTMKDIGLYTCVGHKLNGSLDNESIHIEVEATRSPNIMEPQMDREYIVEKFLSVHFSCVADAVPTPDITWYKDETLLLNDTDGVNILYHRNHTFSNSTIVITRMQNKNEGNYRCDATSGPYKSVKYVYLKVQPFVMPHKTEIIGGVLATILVLIAVVIYLLWKVQKEKQFRKEQAAAGLSNFKKGVTKSLNPELGIDEQAELLPYDEKFEFPVEKLTFGKQLGAGAFGVVYKAEARGMNNAEESTPVAVKMVKKTADNMYIKALASELKIMVHLGKHINIVNLLGACTKNVDKRELIVIVEYCKFGNIHNYMQKHREVFIDQFNDNKEKNLGKVNRGYSCSSGSSAMNSDYFGTHSHATDHTLLNTANSNRSDRKVSETDYIQPEWRSNYESDYSFDGRNPRPLCSRDLLTWAFQIARGMEYLASRKILHGDLAARNVLLAEDNIVKICDFGLAKSIYKNDEYQKKENSLLPVKWLAIECMTDRIFTTQSDVWAFGIVLWEMFSLAKTPYPNMSPQHLLQWLSDGHRLEKPPYADDRLYHVMKQCWEHKPNSRPSFTQLQELLGSFLEDNVRNHYVDLNSAFMDLNVRNGGEDYLAMVSAPDYNNLVTPSPHHYVNEVNSFFPLTPTLDKEGYLQMTPMGRNDPSIFSPRNPSTKFDFDAKKLEPKVAESRGGSELTPMLTLNNLPARSGSDSDHEAGHPSYLKMRPRPYEESDDVFKLNENNERNIQNSAVTNPTYISFDLEIEKKPKENNNYTNIPNGLVK